MTNKITVTIEFHFKGKQFSPSASLDLDELMQLHGTFPEIHSMLAKLNNIDSYSYEYEVMLAEDVQFSDAEGLATEFFTNDSFDQAAFEQKWHENNALSELAPIIKQHLNIEDIEQQQALKAVILAAWKLGKATS